MHSGPGKLSHTKAIDCCVIKCCKCFQKLTLPLRVSGGIGSQSITVVRADVGVHCSPICCLELHSLIMFDCSTCSTQSPTKSFNQDSIFTTRVAILSSFKAVQHFSGAQCRARRFHEKYTLNKSSSNLSPGFCIKCKEQASM